MGIKAEVGVLAALLAAQPDNAAYTEAELEAVNAVLEAHELPAHREPRSRMPVLVLDLGPAVALQGLRRVAAHLAVGPRLPQPGAGQAAADPLLLARYGGQDGGQDGGQRRRLGLRRRRVQEAARPFAHLIEHSEIGGYYVPVDFPHPLPGADGERLGSSRELLSELDALGAALGLPDDVDPDADALWEGLDGEGDGSEPWHAYGAEAFACARLRAAARHSVGYGAALAFR